ncbi:DUF5372 family protein, partial [Roseateles saccharophilus]|uniref:DUF5372 family protein n=1 Tax=Roseateles saccharophilus TaxID=304 RepID=UPI001AA0092C
WQQPSTARDLADPLQFFEVTHPFHPMFGKVFALVDRRHTWGEDRVYFHDAAGRLCRMSAQWTSAAEVDLFVLTSAGRSSLRVSDLLELVGMVEQHRAAEEARKPHRKSSGASRK